MKFGATYNKLNLAQNSYEKSFWNSNKSGKIRVQPAAVSRRVKKDGSGQKQDNSHRKKLKLPKRRIKTIRQHNISKFINTNKPAAKKSQDNLSQEKKQPLIVDCKKNDK